MAGEWREVSLGAICSLIADCPHSTPVWTNSGSVVLRNQNIKNGRLDLSEPSFTDAEHFAHRILRAKPTVGDIVITREAPMGDVCMIPEGLECCLGQRQVLLRPNPEIADPKFVLYALQSQSVQHQIGWNEGTGSTVSNLRIPVLKALNIPTPPLKEQRAIAHILGTLDDKIELNRRMNQTLEDMARALFKSWFVDFDGIASEDMQESELGLIPKGWQVGTLSEILKIIGGGTPKTTIAEYWGGGVPWFSVVDTPAASDVFVTSTEKSITLVGLSESSARLIPKGTTIISARGTVGNLAIAGREMTFNQSCYGLRGKAGVGDYFVFFTVQRMVEQLRSMAHGSVFSTITRETFDAIRIAIPPEKSFRRFEQAASSWFDKILLNVQQSKTLAQLRDTLLPELISGRLQLPRNSLSQPLG